jgi:hypothetical protein
VVGPALVLALAAGLASAPLVAASEAGPGYLAVKSFSAKPQFWGLVRLTATTNGRIPYRADAFISSNTIVGVAWADLDTGTALVATIHPAFPQDSRWPPGIWHLHTVQLAGGATAPNDFCLVAVPTSPLAPVWIFGSTMTVWLPASKLPDAGSGPISVHDIDAAVGFTVHSGDAGCATGLGVRIRT